MRHIFYCSQSAGMTKAEFDVLVERAVRKNHDRGIHGAIAWDGGVGGLITQIIEGPADVVDDLYRTIRADRRHTGVVLLTRADITASQFHDFGLSKRSPFDLYLISIAVTDQYGWGDTSATDFEKHPVRRFEPETPGLGAVL